MLLQDVEVEFRRMEYRPFEAPGDPGAPAYEAELPFTLEQTIAMRARLQQMEAELGAAEDKQNALVAAADCAALARGHDEEKGETQEVLAHLSAQMRLGLESFRQEQDAYFTHVEQEVVRLALGIAARILHREAQIDPLLLTGAVRVALGQLAETTEVCLRVPVAELAMWEEMLRLMPNLPLRPRVEGEESYGPEECVLETRLGSVDLGVRAQLAEIERGFFDLMEQRPPSHTGDNAEFSALNPARRNE